MEENELLVGWDSEYDTSKERLIPISTQFYTIREDGSENSLFLEHVGRKPTLRELVEYLHDLNPEYLKMKWVSHFARAEIQGLENSEDLILNGNAFTVQKSVMGRWSFDIADTTIEIEVVDTFCLSNTSLEKVAEWMGERKLETHGYRESGRMLEWYNQNPEEFKAYAMKDAEIALKFYIRFINTLRSLGLC